MLPELLALKVREAPPASGFQVPTKALVAVAGVEGELLPPLLLPPLLQPIIPIANIRNTPNNMNVFVCFIIPVLSYSIFLGLFLFVTKMQFLRMIFLIFCINYKKQC
jgi:hypothetical protein